MASPSRSFETRTEPSGPSTLLSLVQRLTSDLDSDAEVVETAARLVNSGQVVLTGNFRGCRLDVPADPR